MKKSFRWILTLVMIFGVLTSVAMAAETETAVQNTASGKTYVSLADAVAEAAAGDTVKMLCDIELTETLVIPASADIVLDLNGKILSGVDSVAGTSSVITNKGKLEVTDSSADKTGKITTQALYPDTDWSNEEGTFPSYANNTIRNEGKFILTAGTIENTTPAGGATYCIDNYGGSSCTIDGGKVINENTLAIRLFCGNNIALNINGGEVIGTRAIWVQLASSDPAVAPAVDVTVTGGTITRTKESDLALYSYNYGNSPANVNINISGGTFNGDIGLTGGTTKTAVEKVTVTGGTFTDLYSYAPAELAAQTVSVMGGTFAADPAAYVAEGYFAGKNADGMYVVAPLSADNGVAANGTKGYAALQKAIDDAAAGDTVKMLCDIELTETLVVPAGADIVLDLNGKILSGVDSVAGTSSVITNKGKLEVTDSSADKTGKITTQALYPDTDWSNEEGTFPSYANNTIRNEGKFILTAGTIENTTPAGGATYCIDNYGGSSCTIDGGKVINENTLAIRLFCGNNIALNINGGEVIGTRAIWVQLASSDPAVAPAVDVTVTGGTITRTKESDLALYSYNYGNSPANVNINISGGTFNGDIGLTGGTTKTAVEKVTVTGGTFTDLYSYAPAELAAQTVSVMGGTFAADPTAYVAEGYYAGKNAEGLYVVAPLSAENGAAAIGSKGYATLQKAIDDADAGDTVTVITDLELTEGIVIPASADITLDLNGHTVSQTKEQTAAHSMIQNMGTLTITDSSAKKSGRISYTDSGKGGEYVSNTIQNSGKLTLLAGTVENLSDTTVASNGYPQAIDSSAELIIEGGTVYCENYSAIRIWCSDARVSKVTINDGHIKGCIDLHNVSNKANKGALTIKGGTFDKTANKNVVRFVNFGTDVDEISAVINGGTFNGGLGISSAGQSSASYLKAVLKIFGGRFAESSATKYLGNNNMEITVDEDGYFVVANVPVAKLNGKEYIYLQTAIDAANDGDEIILISDINLTAPVTVPAGKEITLDLNGHTVKQVKECTASYSMIQNKGTLTITGNGKLSFTDTGAGDPNATWGSYTIHNAGTLVVENGTIENLSAQNVTGAPFAHTVFAIFQYSGSTTVNGGTISTPNYRSARLWKGDMTVNGGTFDGQLWVQAVDASAKLTINGGTFGPNWNDGSSVYVENGTYPVKFAVTGGTFTTKIGCANVAGLADSVSGGTFAVDPSAYLAEGCMVEKTDAGYVVGGIYLADGQRYTSFEDAFEALDGKGTVELLGDVTLTADVRIVDGMDITVEGKGKTITGANGYDVFYVQGGKLTLAAGLNVYAPTDCAIYMRGGETVSAANLTKGGTMYSVIQGNGQYFGDMTITGGTITSEVPDMAAIYWPQQGKLTITGGTITGGTVLRQTSGSLEITGGTFLANGPQQAYVPSNGATVPDTGDAVMIEVIGGDSGYEETYPVVISGGTFISENGNAVGSYAAGDAKALTGFISGGSYSDGSIISYLAPGYGTKFFDGMFNVVATNYKITFNTDGGSKVEPVTGVLNTVIEAPAAPTKEGFLFCGWVNAKGEEVTFPYTITKNETFTAVWEELKIVSQPVSVEGTVGDTAKFTVEVSADTVTYQWEYRTSATGAWKNATATGNKTATLSVPCTLSRSGYEYRCKITAADGTVLYTDIVSLTVESGLEIVSQPASVKGTVGETAKFTVKVSADNATYQWEYHTSATGAWKNATATGNKTATLSVPCTLSRSGYEYRCKITAADGTVLYTDAVSLTVTSGLEIVTQPKSVTVGIGGTAKFTVKAEGDGLTYQWMYRTSAKGKWMKASATGNKTATLSVPGTTGRNGYQYQCVVTAGGQSVKSDIVTLTVSAKPVITTQPKAQSVTSGKTATFTVKADGEGLTYQWQYRVSSTGKWLKATATGNKTASMKVPGTAGRNGYQYRCVITDADGDVVYTKAVTLTVK